MKIEKVKKKASFIFCQNCNGFPQSDLNSMSFKVDVKSVLRIGSAHNKRGHADLKIVEIPHFSASL